MDYLNAGARVAPLHHSASPNGPPPPAWPGEDFGGRALRLAGVAGAVLGWGPDAFWCSTPAELGAVLRVMAGEGDAVPPDGAALRGLMERFPDG